MFERASYYQRFVPALVFLAILSGPWQAVFADALPSIKVYTECIERIHPLLLRMTPERDLEPAIDTLVDTFCSQRLEQNLFVQKISLPGTPFFLSRDFAMAAYPDRPFFEFTKWFRSHPFSEAYEMMAKWLKRIGSEQRPGGVLIVQDTRGLSRQATSLLASLLTGTELDLGESVISIPRMTVVLHGADEFHACAEGFR